MVEIKVGYGAARFIWHALYWSFGKPSYGGRCLQITVAMAINNAAIVYITVTHSGSIFGYDDNLAGSWCNSCYVLQLPAW